MASPRTMPESLEGRYEQVRERVARAAERAGRRPDDVLLVAVTKTAEPEQIRELLELGHRDLGENRVQQLAQRAAMVEEYHARLRVHSTSGRAKRDAAETLFAPRPSVEIARAPGAPAPAHPVRWHMIGHLQRNKAKKVVEFARLIHSLDSLRLAEELQALALKKDHVTEVLIEVNASGEPGKHGLPVPAVIPLAEQIETMMGIRVRGLMCMAPLSPRAEDSRPTFARCRELFEEMAGRRLSDGRFNILSMGMSNDFEVAVAEGANIVRVGTAIFGESRRPEPEDDED